MSDITPEEAKEFLDEYLGTCELLPADELLAISEQLVREYEDQSNKAIDQRTYPDTIHPTENFHANYGTCEMLPAVDLPVTPELSTWQNEEHLNKPIDQWTYCDTIHPTENVYSNCVLPRDGEAQAITPPIDEIGDATGKGEWINCRTINTKNDSDPPTIIGCSLCLAQFDSLEAFAAHENYSRVNGTCNYCGRIFCTEGTFKQHILDTHAYEMTRVRRFSCHICHKYFDSEGLLYHHQYSAHPMAKRKCDICGEMFCDPDKYKQHKMSHPKSLFSCRFCKRKFKKKKNLEDHIPEHLPDLFWTHKCEICNVRFPQAAQLWEHNQQLRDEHLRQVICAIENFLDGRN